MLVILDRDGVINHYDGSYICSPTAWLPLPGSLEAIARLCHAGYTVAIATNQSGIGRGYYDVDTLEAMHSKMADLLKPLGGRVDLIAYCPHHPDQHCHCRKPATGLLEQIRQQLGLSTLAGTLMVGDSRKDLEAALSAGCQPCLVRTGNGRETEHHLRERPLAGVQVYDNLATLVDTLLATSR
ncbi:D-glycero-beta-D-manno-heptose 1,7-bisphosphate 7-phosphatase [Marinobacter xestospongiae]|uniref:D,D-heptose 1,7-bisphosphate phosphatase n=1 Tax=Marinobacter xestospongiae TaxID=994319 RepID=A0ABU3VZA8_9GAMM|nr:D-glycero-beta-D-manno-heptose 1,7-bisphosphate 7-phosphatase [Marinobacter xestospongiae]MDV2079628.1 D-glycero-beta-D-manno-heptose 1,7-bisphosphate 7-phosphatase [Marinobacter xestospongiae]